MARDVTRIRSKDEFIALLRRVADTLEQGEPLRIQVGGVRLAVPSDAELSVEHEADDDAHEIELQMRWREGTSRA
jgi:amphi-Trp domain-containing protein